MGFSGLAAGLQRVCSGFLTGLDVVMKCNRLARRWTQLLLVMTRMLPAAI